jgi:hypothetical protein
MTSITAGGLPEPRLLFHRPGSRPRRPGRSPVVGRPTQQRDGTLRIQASQLLAPEPLHFLARLLPGIHPSATESHLFGCPISQARRPCAHNPIVSTIGPWGKAGPEKGEQSQFSFRENGTVPFGRATVIVSPHTPGVRMSPSLSITTSPVSKSSAAGFMVRLYILGFFVGFSNISSHVIRLPV